MSNMNKNIFNFNNSYITLSDYFFTKVNPISVKNPKLVIFNDQLAKDLNIKIDNVDKVYLTNILSGNVLLDNGGYYSQSYLGHQYGRLNMLGDGRANMLGEHITDNNQRFDIQLKGSGVTPYSRNGDGRAALGPMLREYIISEAMYHLGVPTTRSLAVIQTGETIQRETLLPGAILTRIAKSHIRFGTFEFAASLNDMNKLNQLLNYTINRHYPELNQSNHKALDFLAFIMKKQIDLVVDWMRIGFIHGVMNTDNMSIACETIDYGPCAFMDEFDPETVFSSIDKHGRYAFANQAPILQWNLTRLAETLIPLIDDDEKIAIQKAEALIKSFTSKYQTKWLNMMRDKLGLINPSDKDLPLIQRLLQWMKLNNADYTNTFKDLSYDELEKDTYKSGEFQLWCEEWKERIKDHEPKSYELMKKVNPVIIPRNHQVAKILKQVEQGKIQSLYSLLDAIKEPYQNYKIYADYQKTPTENEKVYQTFCGT